MVWHLLIVDAQAFERDADPEDFSLEAMVAHECGHQLLFRRRPLHSIKQREISGVTEEILASLLGSIIVKSETDRELLYSKAVVEALERGLATDYANRLLHRIRDILRQLL